MSIRGYTQTHTRRLVAVLVFSVFVYLLGETMHSGAALCCVRILYYF
jgi:hypothetical protein